MMVRMVYERRDVIPLIGEAFRRYGFEGTSISRLTEHTKLGKGSLYNFFPGGKDAMAEAVLDHIHQWFETEIFKPLDELNPSEALDMMFAGVSKYFRSGQRICLVGAFALEETRDRFSSAVCSYFDRWIRALSGALQRSGMNSADAGTLAAEVVAGIQGAIVLSRALMDETRFAAIIARLAQRCRGG